MRVQEILTGEVIHRLFAEVSGQHRILKHMSWGRDLRGRSHSVRARLPTIDVYGRILTRKKNSLFYESIFEVSRKWNPGDSWAEESH